MERGSSTMSVGVETWKKSPGRCRVVPYTSSADVQWKSSLRVEQIPNKAIGIATNQLAVALLMRDALSWRWKLSTRLLALGW